MPAINVVDSTMYYREEDSGTPISGANRSAVRPARFHRSSDTPTRDSAKTPKCMRCGCVSTRPDNTFAPSTSLLVE
jgi:succinate dehydrogenase/fumarate reductase-like Fe-S protein